MKVETKPGSEEQPIPTDRPIVIRWDMPGATPAAFAVGLPGGVAVPDISLQLFRRMLLGGDENNRPDESSVRSTADGAGNSATGSAGDTRVQARQSETAE